MLIPKLAAVRHIGGCSLADDEPDPLRIGEIVHRCEGDGQCTEHLVTHIDRKGWAETVRLDPDIRGFVSHLAVWPEEGFNKWSVLHRAVDCRKVMGR